MARTIKDAQLDSRAARDRLKPRRKPYYRKLETGLDLGFRKPRGRKGKPAVSGKWVMRRFVKGQKSISGGSQPYVVEVIGIADDLTDSDGVLVLDFTQAQNLARERCRTAAHGENVGPYTVAPCIADYIQLLHHQGKDTYEVEKRANAFILPALGDIECAKLTSKTLRAWLDKMATTPARKRTKKGEKQKHVELDKSDDEALRRRRASANRVWTTLRAALNHAFAENRIASNVEWQRVKPFKNVDNADIRFLDEAEAQRLIRCADNEFRPMIAAALASGCRYGELTNLKVSHYSADNKTLSIVKSKSGKPRTIYLTDEGAQLFRGLAAGRLGSEPLIRRNDGLPWDTSHQTRRMKEACARAKIEPEITFHDLRHTYASLLVKAGVPMKYVAEALGHHANTAMTEKHYARLVPSHVATTIRANAPKLGLPKSNVAGMR
jgi:integrase